MKEQSKPRYGMLSNIKFMIKLAWKNCKSVIWLALLLSMIGVMANLLELFIVPTILKILERHSSLKELILTIIFFTFGLLLVGVVTAYINENKLFGRIEIRSIIIIKIHDKFATTSYPNIEKQGFLKHLEKAKKSVQANSEATEAVWNTLETLLKNGIGFLIYLFLLSKLNAFVVVITLVTTITGYLVSNKLNNWGYCHRDEEAEISVKMNYIGKEVEDQALAKDIRLFGMQTWLEELYDKALKAYKAFCARGEKVYLWADITDIGLSFLRNGIAYAYLINRTLNGHLGVAQFLLYFTAISGFTAWITGILSGLSTLHKQSLDISVVREFIEIDEDFKFEGGVLLEVDKNKEYCLELKNVTFRYEGAEKDTLKNINLLINSGEKLAIVGLNGAGKTTLIKLICGFYDPTLGEVLLNGKNIREFNRRDYYKHFSAVFQDFSMLAASIAVNIAQTDENIDMEKVHNCIEKAGIKHKLETLPYGVDTKLGKDVFEDAVELSGGEMQRLMLARALYKGSPFIILDEPTAALDPIAERDIYNKYNELTEGCTSIYISHRLASTRFCDRIILIENGVIAEEGTHEELLENGKKYAQLFQIQSQYYNEGKDE